MALEVDVWSGSPSQIKNLGVYIACGIISLTIIGAVFAIPYAFWKYFVVRCQRYELTSQRLKLHSGVLNKKIDELELYRVKDTKLEQPLFLRIFGLGNVTLISSDTTTPVSLVYAIKDAKELREQIRALVEGRRDQKRVRLAEVE